MTDRRGAKGRDKFEPRHGEGRRGGSVTVRLSLADGTWRSPGLPAGRADAGEPCPAPTRGGAPSGRRSASDFRQRWACVSILALFALVALVFASSAGAAAQRNLKEEFGPAAKPTIEHGSEVVVDHATGDLLISSGAPLGGGSTIRRFHADGTPAPFEALGTNTIDGAEANGKPCAEEPASCDQTPLNGIEVYESPDLRRFEVAIDESGGVTDGDIYLSQYGTQNVEESSTVYVFSGSGRYLGQLTGYGQKEYRLNRPTGVTVDSSGAVYVADDKSQINVFVPTQNPVTNADFVANIPYPESVTGGFYKNGGNANALAVGTGPTAGSLFAAYVEPTCLYNSLGECVGSEPLESIVQFDKESGQVLSVFDLAEIGTKFVTIKGTVAVNPTNGNVLDGSGNEFEVRAGSEAVQVSHVDPAIRPDLRIGLAVDSSNELISVRQVRKEVEGQTIVSSVVSKFGAPAVVPTVTANPAEDVSGTRANLSGTVDAGQLPLAAEGCFFEYGLAREPPAEVGSGVFVVYEHSVPCKGSVPADSEPHSVGATLTGLEPGGTTYGFRLVAVNQNGREETAPPVFLTTADIAATEPASAIGLTAATLNGAVYPEGTQLSECFFEYGRSTSAIFEKTVPCSPGVTAIDADFRPHKVEAAIGGLENEATYRYRLVATSKTFGTAIGEEETFSTFGLPKVIEARASGADQSSVNLEARIDPAGFGTTYRFEWGPTAAYGNVAPLEFEPFIGSDGEPILVKARLTGLAAGGAYHYRVVAESNRGVAVSPDQIAETLNSCNLPEGRCFEEVSRNEAGPVAIPGEVNAQIELHFQASENPGGFAYPVESGYPDATKGAEVLYRGARTGAGWENRQLSAPIIALNERNDASSQVGRVAWLADDLSCGFQESTSPLTPDPAMNLVREEGGGNLYRINPDGSYTPVTTLPPQGPVGVGLGNYGLAWASRDCGVALFSSVFTYSGVPAAPGDNTQQLYEWRDGSLRNAAIVPGPGGEDVVVEGVPGAGPEDTQNAVSEDGSRLFFSAKRQTSPDPAEIGTRAIFVREGGSETRDISLSQTAVPDEGASYQWATPDGSKVFFIANSGLAQGAPGSGQPCEPKSGKGCELYEYDLDSGALTDRSQTPVDGGAQVKGFLGASADGSRVYFASSNRLVPGGGASLERNLRTGTFSIYSAVDGAIAFAGTLDGTGLVTSLVERASSQNSQVSPDGRYLLFESGARVTEYDGEGVHEVYLFDAATGKTTCVSCRQDGRPSQDNRYGNPGYELLKRGQILNNNLHPPQFLTERNGEAIVFFNSPDPLAPGAVPGQNNVYEWSHDQIFRLASAPAGSQRVASAARFAIFGGAGADATDIYLVTPETLSWEDGDERSSAYDARIGGGFPEPPPPAAPCQAGAERSCAAPPPSTTRPRTADTTGDSGSQNAEPKKKKHAKKKHRKKKHHKKRRSKQRRGAKDSARRSNGNGRKGK